MNDEPKLFIDHKEVIPESRIEQVLSEQYDNPLTGGNYGRDKFYERIRTQYVGISRSDVDKFIQNDETHQLHRPITKKLQVTRPLSVPEGPFVHWQMDLIELGSTLVHDNLGYQYVLTVIDIFSKYAWAIKLKTKEGKEVTDALSGILQNTLSPTVLQSDNGKEFKNQWMTIESRYMDHHIDHNLKGVLKGSTEL